MTRQECIIEVNAQLIHSFTGDGVMSWWLRPITFGDLAGETPMKALIDPGKFEELISLATASRSSDAT